jgi:hypothetical protein
MLTIRYARPEMRAPIRTWLRRNAGTVAGVGLTTLAMAAAATLAVDCEPMPTGWLDCPVAAEGALVMNLAGDAPFEPPVLEANAEAIRVAPDAKRDPRAPQ